MAVVTQPILANSFEGLTAGSTPGAALGGAAGPGANLGTAAGMGWDTVTVTAGSTMTIDATVAHSGSKSCKITTTSGVTCYAMWASSGMLPNATAKVWFRLYLYLTSNPATQHQLLVGTNSGTGVADLLITSTGKLAMRAKASGANVVLSTNSVPLNQWFRVEGFMLSDAAAGQVEVKLFSAADSTTATETQTSAANLNTLGGVVNQFRWGLGSGGVANVSWNMDDVALSTAGYIGPGAIVQQMAAGAPTQDGFTVISKPVGGTSCRLKVATDAALTQNVLFVAAQAPDQYGYVKHVVTGLLPGTQYYCAIADTPNGGAEMICGPQTGAVKTLKPAGSPQNFTVSFASCIDNADELPSPSAAIDDWVAWNADLKIHLGDFSYANPVFTNVPDNLAILEEQNLYYDTGALTATGWGYNCRSDHDTGPDNGDSGPAGSVPWMPFNVAAWQEVFPAGPLGDTAFSPVHGLYQTWVVGRVRFILLDIRTVDRSPGGNTDDGSKTMLGAAQLAWFKEQLLQPEPLKVIIDDTAWMGDFLGTDLDKWWSYDTERQAIIAYLAANQAPVGHVMWWHGDTHALGTATPAANTWGGFPVYCAAPMRQSGAAVPDASTFTQLYNNAGGECRQYGRVTFTDDGSAITASFSGWDALNQVERIAQADVFSTGTLTATPDSFATAQDAAAYGFVLPDGSDGLLARATQAIRDTAGFPITQATSTVELDAHGRILHLPSPAVVSVTTVTDVTDGDDTVVTDWRLIGRGRVRLGHTVPHREFGRFSVQFVHGFATIPPGVVMLTCKVAYRLAASPVAAQAGIKSQTVGSVSWSVSDTLSEQLTDGEVCQLAASVPVRRAWQVRL